MRDKLRTQSGVAAVEFAVILPILVLIGVGICEFSVIYYDKAMITNASRVGARVGIKLTDEPWDDTRTKIENEIDSYFKNLTSMEFLLLSLGNPSNLTTEKYITRAPDPSTGNYSPGGTLAVTVKYTYTFAVLPNFITSIINPITLTGETVMVFE